MTLEAIGQKLKAAREAQGLSLRQIYERTKIPINHLQALDAGQPDDLPEPVYIAGFIKRYAECIGLDGQVLADEYKRGEHGGNNGNGNAAKAPPIPAYASQEYLKAARIDTSPPAYKMAPFYVIGVVALIAVLSWYSMQAATNKNEDASQQSLKDSISHIQQQTPGPSASTPTAGTAGQDATASATTPGTPTTSESDNKIVLTATDKTWVQVKRLHSTDPALFTGTMKPGDTETFDEPAGVHVTAGNAGGLSVDFKGKIEPFGEAGKRAERSFSSKSSTTAASADSTKTASSSSTSSSSGSIKTADNKTTKSSSSTSTTKTASHRSHDDGTRSIPGDDGMRSIDVPYRYSEGRLDAN